MGSAESCCLPALTRFTGQGCTGPDRHLPEQMHIARRRGFGVRYPTDSCFGYRWRPLKYRRTIFGGSEPQLEECESGRIGTLGKRVKGDLPWVRIPPPPLSLPRSGAYGALGAAERSERLIAILIAHDVKFGRTGMMSQAVITLLATISGGFLVLAGNALEHRWEWN